MTECKPLWRGDVVDCETVLPKGTVLTEAMWELYKLNFRFNLVRLDQVLTKSGEWDVDRQQECRMLIERCFFNGHHHDFRLGYPEILPMNAGLASNNFANHFTYIQHLAHLMLDWCTPLPTTITGLINQKTPTIADIQNFELVVVEFYCQTFYNKMNRAPLALHHIVPPS